MLKSQLLKINQKYLKSVPRPSKERYDEIKKDILSQGQHLAIITNQDNTILDGHTRYQICQELKIIPKTEKREFKNKLEEERFVYCVNVKRRDLPDFVHIELSLKIHEIDSKIGEKKRNSNLKQNDTDCLISDKRKKHDTLKEVAMETKSSRDTVSKVKKILKKGSEKDIEDLRNGKDGISINKISKQINKEEKKKERQEYIKKIQVKLPETVTLYNHDFKKTKIKNNSVSLIFTDPPYLEKYLYLYEELAVQANMVLRDGGSLLCYVGHYAVGKIINMIEAQGLKFHWPIAVIHSGPSASMWSQKVLVGYKLLLWFTKGKYEGEYVRDVIQSKFQGKELHEWAQSTVESDYYIKYMTLENDIVYDPFMGQGTFGVSAVNQNRQFIGCEIDADHFANAEKMISVARR